jgi:2-keto-3-deoxy-L-rhamnonate aldolase RhmA
VREFLESFPRRVRAAGKAAGISVGGADAAIEAYQQGYRMIAIGHLLFAGANGLKADLARLRSLYPPAG